MRVEHDAGGARQPARLIELTLCRWRISSQNRLFMTGFFTFIAIFEGFIQI